MKLGIREALFVAVLLGLLGSSWFFVFAKANEKRAKLEAECEAKQAQLNALRQVTAGIEDLGAKIKELQQAIAFFESKLPKQKEIDKILKEVWQMADASALQMRTIKTLKSERAASYSEQPIQISLGGNFIGYHKFLTQLEKLPRITRITQMRLEKIDGRDGEMQAQMTLSIFFEPDSTGDAVSAVAAGQ